MRGSPASCTRCGFKNDPVAASCTFCHVALTPRALRCRLLRPGAPSLELDPATGERLSTLVRGRPVAVLSGPNMADEVLAGLPGASVIASRVRQTVKPGSIISLHLGHAGTVAAFPTLVADVWARGLEPVLVRDLLK